MERAHDARLLGTGASLCRAVHGLLSHRAGLTGSILAFDGEINR
jgi:hypothetical protein